VAQVTEQVHGVLRGTDPARKGRHGVVTVRYLSFFTRWYVPTLAGENPLELKKKSGLRAQWAAVFFEVAGCFLLGLPGVSLRAISTAVSACAACC
jgi:hypothetical protein